MDSVSVTIVVLFGSVAAFGLFVETGSRYAENKSRYGSAIAQRLLVKDIVEWSMFLALAVTLFLIVGREWDVFVTTFFYLTILWLWIDFLVSVIARWNFGSILLDIGKPDQVFSKAAVFSAIYAGLALGDFLLDGLEIKNVAKIAAFVSLAVVYFLRGRMNSFVTEKGFFASSNRVKWKQIKNYRWIGSSDTMGWLLITVKGRPTLFDMRIVSIPSRYKDEINDLLADHVPAGRL